MTPEKTPQEVVAFIDAHRTRESGGLRGGPPTRESQTGGGPRLRKYVVTEQQTISVPVQREVVEIQEDPSDEQR